MNDPLNQPPPEHEALAPLHFLLGRWEGAGVVGYPTIESANFGQEITFSHNGKPFLIYTSRTWLLDEEGQIGGRSPRKPGTGGRSRRTSWKCCWCTRPGSARSTWAK